MKSVWDGEKHLETWQEEISIDELLGYELKGLSKSQLWDLEHENTYKSWSAGTEHTGL